jgi:hypothetical protein
VSGTELVLPYNSSNNGPVRVGNGVLGVYGISDAGVATWVCLFGILWNIYVCM